MNIFITGGTSGIGLACAQKFDAEGWGVNVLSKRSGHDLMDYKDIPSWFSKLDPVDVLLNCAGICYHTPFLKTDIRSLGSEIMIVNFLSNLMVTREFLIQGKLKEGGTVLNILSTDIEIHPKDNIYYNCSKAALLEATLSLAWELPTYMFRGLILGLTKTPMSDSVVLDPSLPIPDKYLQPEEVADYIFNRVITDSEGGEVIWRLTP